MERINFIASLYAPNPLETTYWVDLTEDPTGGVIKTYDGKKWNQIKGEAQSVDAYTKSEADDKFATKSEVNGKANKSTTLAGYGITDAYTKTEVDGKINSKANSSDVYTKSQTDSQIETKVAALVSQAPETLDTLDELAAALRDDPNFATTVSNQIGTKLNTSTYNADKATFATKTELSSKVNGTGITNIEVVTELPGTQNENTLYIVKAA